MEAIVVSSGDVRTEGSPLCACVCVCVRVCCMLSQAQGQSQTYGNLHAKLRLMARWYATCHLVGLSRAVTIQAVAYAPFLRHAHKTQREPEARPDTRRCRGALVHEDTAGAAAVTVGCSRTLEACELGSVWMLEKDERWYEKKHVCNASPDQAL